MTQTPSNSDRSSQQAASQQRGKSPMDRRVKIGFLIILVVAGVVLWLQQRRDPRLSGWGKDLPGALQQAKADRRLVLVFFTGAPMSQNDKHAVANVVTTARTQKALNELRCVKVHLSINHNEVEAKTYQVKSTPTYLLLDSSGKELQRTSGLTNDVSFIKDFLGKARP